MSEKQFHNFGKFDLELGGCLPELTIAYHTYGKMNTDQSNVIWVCHALTANSDPSVWWDGLVGKGKLFDPEKYFIVCANILGSCYGTTGPLSVNPETGKPYYYSFPDVTIRDVVKSFILLRKKLGIEKINLGIGGSCGGYQIMEWAMMEPQVIENQCILCSSPKEAPWGVAIHTAHRSAIELDPTWGIETAHAGLEGMKRARQIGLLFYRNHEAYNIRQKEESENKTDEFKVSSYLKYQGEKLAKRFNAISYHKLTKVLDTHNIARDRFDTMEEALASIGQRTLIIGIHSDLLCPVSEQVHMNEHIPDCEYQEIESLYGHDGFLIENEEISVAIRNRFEFIS